MFSKKQGSEYIAKTNKLSKRAIADNINELDATIFINEIKEVLNYHDWRYYVVHEPIIEDFVYDQLFKKLKSLETQFNHLITQDSPTQRVARGLSEGFDNVPHLIPMLSLDNSYNYEDLVDFENRLKKLTESENFNYCVEPKFDGSSLALIYENDILVRAATRGNGVSGDDITNNVKVIRSIPLKANFSKFGIYKVELRGEVVIEKGVFKQLNVKRAEENKALKKAGRKELELYKNPRNTAAGGLRAKDSDITAKRGMEAFIYQVGIAFDKAGKDITETKFSSHHGNIQMLADLGFKTPSEETLLAKNIEEVLAFCQNWEDKRSDYSYEIDGMVIKLDNVELQNLVGATAHHPRWAIAYKFKAQEGKAKLYHVDFQIGRTGAVTPVAKICSVEYYPFIKDKKYAEINIDEVIGLSLAGVEVKNVSLHNEDFILEKDIHIGDSILVERAGEVIPYVTGVVKEERVGNEKPVPFPKVCLCDFKSSLEKPEGESVWRCVHPQCPFQLEESIIHFVSKGAMNIDGLGRDIIKRFMKQGIINNILDIYQLDYDAILSLEGWKEKSVEKLKLNIEKSKSQPMWRLLVGLGIRHIGGTTAKALAKNINHLLDFCEWTEEQLMDLPDIGPKAANAIATFFQDKENISLIKNIEEKGINVVSSQIQKHSDKLNGKTFLFTGTLKMMGRNEAKEMVESNGGKNISSVSKNLDYLVIGEKAGSKLKKATDLGTIKIVSEKTFLDMIK